MKVDEIGRWNGVKENGETVVILKTQKIEETRNLAGKTSQIRKLPEYKLDDGTALTQIDDQSFKIARTDEIVRKV